jgi:transposase
VHRDSVTACARLVERDGEVVEDLEQFPTTSAGIARLGAWLLARGVTTVAMEATGVYWKPLYYGLEDVIGEIWLCNAMHVRNVPGHKTDLADAAWLADVVAHGMVQPSFVPPPPIRALRELTRYRKTQVDARGQEIQRLEKVLQDAGVKLTSVASTVWSMSSRAMIEALIAGERDPAILADFAKGRMRPKREALTEAFAAHWSEHHSIVAARIIAHIDYLDRSISELSVAIGDRLDPFQDMIQRMCDVPGVQRTTAEVVIAETGGDMAAFATPEQLCSWAGLAPANHESAGKHRPAGTRKGGRWLKRALIESAKSASKTKDTYLAARYRRIARRRGKNRATVAVAHSILVVLWHLMADPELEYHDLGADYYDRRQDPKREADRIVRQLEQLGYHVTLEPIAA